MSSQAILGMKRFTAEQTADNWHASVADVRSWCKSNYIDGAVKSKTFPFAWKIPANAKRPIDEPLIRELLWQLIEFQNKRIAEVDLSDWGIPPCDIGGCCQALANEAYLDTSVISSAHLTKKALSILGREGCDASSNEPPKVLIWGAAAVGTAACSAANQLMM